MKTQINDISSFMAERNNRIVSFGGKKEELQSLLDQLDKQYSAIVEQLQQYQQEKPSYNLSLVYHGEHFNFFLPKSWFEGSVSEQSYQQVEDFYKKGEFPISKLINPPVEDKIVLDVIAAIQIAKENDERLGWLFQAIVVHLMLLVRSTSDNDEYPNYIAITQEEGDKLRSHIKRLPLHPSESTGVDANAAQRPQYPH